MLIVPTAAFSSHLSVRPGLLLAPLFSAALSAPGPSGNREGGVPTGGSLIGPSRFLATSCSSFRYPGIPTMARGGVVVLRHPVWLGGAGAGIACPLLNPVEENG